MWGWQPAGPPSGYSAAAARRHPVLGTVSPLHELCQAWLSLAAAHHSPMPQFPQQEAACSPSPVGQDGCTAEQREVSCCPGCCAVLHIPEGRCHAGTPCAPCQLPTHAHPGTIKLSQVPPPAPLYRLPPTDPPARHARGDVLPRGWRGAPAAQPQGPLPGAVREAVGQGAVHFLLLLGAAQALVVASLTHG